ncbi:MAG: hypothetical protein LKE46_08970 [Clostridium sp.]|jgi:Gpi18-like mannosyltransferase|uniref:hypothetical protein n=1 Tax=Clostridium sp. TaxID=1506 RepID=UPI0025C6EAFA|nr:hypothetical protein [Clostridium sp.]MCH3964398.1 hypothetical protein [Clostridium sp.]MCI1715573.1 hypothetical protein [Clostridium sp.]MCI1799635.1 hypothetical protein [Clostridium sp.]MCI1813757.1 hypothetical protein [Clostridium sp.]MCI1870448.1 hypothetical protein [Clostridium sp.]
MATVSMKKNPTKAILILLIIFFFASCIFALKNYKPTGTSHFQNGAVQFQPGSKKTPIQGQERHSISQNGGGNMRFGAADSKYSPFLTVYLMVFMGMIFFLLYSIKRKKIIVENGNRKIVIFSILIIGLLLRLILSTVVEGYSGDISLFRNWASNAANNFPQFYENSRSSDYPPLYIYILFIIGKICSIGSLSTYYTLILKVPSIAADILTAYLIYRLAKKHLPFEMSLLMILLYTFNPAVFIDSALWGQVDSFFTLLVVLSIYMICSGKPVFSSMLFTCSILMKPQGIIFLPVLFFELVRRKKPVLFIKSVISALATAAVIVLPFSYNKGFLWILNLYSKAISEYPYASVNGFNFFNLIGGNYKQSSNTFFLLSYGTWGMIAIIAVTLFSWFVYVKSRNKIFALAAALIQIAGVFTFSTGMHERYLFPALALSILCCACLKDRRFFILCMGYTITIYANVYSVLFGGSGGMNMTSGTHSILSDGISLINIILFIYLIKISVDMVKSNKLTNNRNYM